MHCFNIFFLAKLIQLRLSYDRGCRFILCTISLLKHVLLNLKLKFVVTSLAFIFRNLYTIEAGLVSNLKLIFRCSSHFYKIKHKVGVDVILKLKKLLRKINCK